MISIYQKRDEITSKDGEAKVIELRGLSTDTKPTTFGENGVANGTIFIEIDTGKMFMYDAENQLWKEV